MSNVPATDDRTTGGLLTAEQLSQRLQVPMSWVYRAARQGRIPAVKLGRYTRFDADDVRRWIADQKERAA